MREIFFENISFCLCGVLFLMPDFQNKIIVEVYDFMIVDENKNNK